MRRTDLYLKESQLALLKKEKEKTGVNTSEFMRRLIDKYFAKEVKKTK